MREATILQKIKVRDPSGLEALMDIYVPYVSVIVWNILRDAMSPEDAEEVVSDVFLAAWNQSFDLRPGHVKGWLGAVARHKAKDKLRQTGQTLPLEDNVLDIPSSDHPSEDMSAQKSEGWVRPSSKLLGRRRPGSVPPPLLLRSINKRNFSQHGPKRINNKN